MTHRINFIVLDSNLFLWIPIFNLMEGGTIVHLTTVFYLSV